MGRGEKERRRRADVPVLQRHEGDDGDVKRQRDKDDADVELEQGPVLGHARVHELGLDQVDKVEVQAGVQEQEDGLFDAVPDVVDENVFLGDLQLGGDPDAEDGDVDEEDHGAAAPLEQPLGAPRRDEQGAAVDDDLDQAVQLEAP